MLSSLSATLVDDSVQQLDGMDGAVPDLAELLDCDADEIIVYRYAEPSVSHAC